MHDSGEHFRRIEGTTDELFRTESGMTITVTNRISPSEFPTLWNMVETGFKELNQKSYEKQDMTREELEGDLESESVLKYVARDTEGKLLGLLTVHVGLEDITWTDTSDLERAQETTDPDAEAYYVGTIVVPVSERGTDAATNLIRGALLHFKKTNAKRYEDALVFFDCADANYPWLGEFIQTVGSPSEQFPDLKTHVKELYADAWVDDGGHTYKVHRVPDDLQGRMLDKQHYYAISIDR